VNLQNSIYGGLERVRVVVGITGATGVIYGIRLLQAFMDAGVESHLVVSEWGGKTIEVETSYTIEEVKSLATYCYDPLDLTASIASGSLLIDGMVIAPCSMKSLAAIATGYLRISFQGLPMSQSRSKGLWCLWLERLRSALSTWRIC